MIFSSCPLCSSWLIFNVDFQLGRGRMFHRYCFRNSTTSIESSFEFHPAWGECADQVVEDDVGDVFIKDAFVAIALQIEFQALEFDAFFGGDVGEGQGSEVGLAGLGADRGELGADDLDLVIPLRELVVEGLEQVLEVGHSGGASPFNGPSIVA